MRPHELCEPVAEDEDLLHCRAGAGRGSDTSAAALRWARARASRTEASAWRCRRPGPGHGPRSPPVLSLGFSLPGSRGATVPLMPTTYSLRSSLAARLELLPRVGLEDDLRDPVAVAQVDEDQPAEVAIGVDPAVQDDRFAHVVSRQFAASMCSFVEHNSHRATKYFRRFRSVVTIPRTVRNRQGGEDWDTSAARPVRCDHRLSGCTGRPARPRSICRQLRRAI